MEKNFLPFGEVECTERPGSGLELQSGCHIGTYLKRRMQVWLSREPTCAQRCPAREEAKFKAQFMTAEPSWPGRVEGYTAKGLWGSAQCSWWAGGCVQNGGFWSEPPVRAMSWELDRQELSTRDSLQEGRAIETGVQTSGKGKFAHPPPAGLQTPRDSEASFKTPSPVRISKRALYGLLSDTMLALPRVLFHWQ